jgi:2-polyprenyl-3-methyl-5-hydroxy-6-metoxy-1,4-benzoquinol methylase
MKTISDAYRTLNKQLHDETPGYGAKADARAPDLVKLATKNGFKTILDYGCGKGALKPAVATMAPQLTVLEYDPAIEGKETLPTEPVDMIAALDVMEHIEPEFLDSALQSMHALKPKCVFLLVSTRPATKTLADGRNAHLIVEKKEWWLPRLTAYFHQAHCVEFPTSFLFIGIPLPEVPRG